VDRLFSPWRYQYITADRSQSGCVFCDIASSSNDETNLVIHRAQHNFVVLNRFPYSSGHLMIVPYEHAPSLAGVPTETSAEMMMLMCRAELSLRDAYRPDGLNIGMNIGASAGAGVAGHIHMHMLPRWAGDANFMTTIAETRVIPEDLAVSYRKLQDACARW
jgi:ATP adenylyltransferase